jgi:hypothetical protein
MKRHTICSAGFGEKHNNFVLYHFLTEYSPLEKNSGLALTARQNQASIRLTILYTVPLQKKFLKMCKGAFFRRYSSTSGIYQTNQFPQRKENRLKVD